MPSSTNTIADLSQLPAMLSKLDELYRQAFGKTFLQVTSETVKDAQDIVAAQHKRTL